jgi:hypothetical protein
MLTRLNVCSTYMARVHSDRCHLCLQPENAHPHDDDRQYWAQWLVWSVLMDLHPWFADGADRRSL